MDKVHMIMDWYKKNAVWVTPMMIGVLANLYNGMSDYPQAKSFLKWLIDALSIVTKKDAENTFKLPFKGSKVPAGKSHMRTGASAVALLPLVALPLFLSGCYCWSVEHSTEQKCIIAKQTVDCTVDSIKSVVPGLLPIIMGLISGNTGSINWNEILQRLESHGFANAICILNVLQNDLISKPMASPEQSQKMAAMKELMQKFYDKYHAGNVKVCFQPLDGGAKVCR